MDVRELVLRLGDNREDVLKRASQCMTAEELRPLAEESNIELTEEETVQLLNLIHPDRQELSDTELDQVTGGAEKTTEKEPQCCGRPMHYVGQKNLYRIWQCWWCSKYKHQPIFYWD